jgi:hypothetical protein
MGRGRQKAKQTKVARELKYYSQETDFSALEQELRGENNTDFIDERHYEDELIDKYADWLQEDLKPTAKAS